MGDTGSMELFGSQGDHRMFVDHLTAETADKVHGYKQGRDVWVWKPVVNRDNHWFDCVVGCAVAASLLGIARDGRTQGVGNPVVENPMGMAERQADARARYQARKKRA
jgi:hypothetical protein